MLATAALQNTLIRQFIRCTLQNVGPPFSFRAVESVPRRIETKSLKYSLEILVHIEMTAHRYCSFPRSMKAGFLFLHILKVLYWIESWRLWRPFIVTCSQPIFIFKKPVGDDLSFVTWSTELKAAIRRWMQCGHKGKVTDTQTVAFK